MTSLTILLLECLAYKVIPSKWKSIDEVTPSLYSIGQTHKYKGSSTPEVCTRHNSQFVMLPRYLIIVLPILADFAAAATSEFERLGLMLNLSASADGADCEGTSCPLGGCCVASLCCDGT